MAINFPNAPATNDEYTFAGRTWRYNGEAWVAITPPIVTAGIADLAVTQAKIASLFGPAPQARLTLESAVAVSVTDQLAKTTIYYTNHTGQGTPYFDGTRFLWWISTGQPSLALDSDSGHTGYHQSGKNFDLFFDYNAGAPRLVSGPAWTNDTTPADAITILGGLWVNNASIVVRFGTLSGDTATISANRLTWVGTFRASANGQTEDSLVKRFLWNTYNRVARPMRRLETTDTWTYTTDTYRQANAAAANQLEVVRGIDEDMMAVDIGAAAKSSVAGVNPAVSVGLDSTTTGVTGVINGLKGLSVAEIYDQLFASWRGYPGRGYHTLVWLERTTASGTCTWVGDVGVPAKFQCGIYATVMS